jgi:ferric-dicitrate binding protein FerR (iron transport regulator)
MIARAFALIALLVVAATAASAQAVGTQFEVSDLSGVYRCVRQCAGAGLVRLSEAGSYISPTNLANPPGARLSGLA